MRKTYPYQTHNGMHFPDALLGDNLFYAIDFSDWLENENDTFVEAVWTVPSALETSGSYVQGNEAAVRINAKKLGTFRIECSLKCVDAGVTQTKNVVMLLKVL